MSIRYAERLAFLLVMIALFAWVALESRDFPRLARIFPYTVALVALALCGVELLRMLVAGWRAQTAKTAPEPEETEEPSLTKQFGAVLPYILWLGLYYLAIDLLGFVVASGLFVFLFITILGKMRWYSALVATGLLLAFVLVFGDALNLHWPSGRIEEWLGVNLP